MSKTPSEYSELKRVRDFEKSVLRKSFRRLCEPGNHIPDCPPTNQHCPHRREELVTDGGRDVGESWASSLYYCESCEQVFPDYDAWMDHANGPFADVAEASAAMRELHPGEPIPEGATVASGQCAYPEPTRADGGRDYEQELETMRAKAREFLESDELETFALVAQTDTELNTVTGSNQEEPTTDLLMSVYGIADNVATRMNTRENMGMTPVDVMKWATHFQQEHAETGEREVHDLSHGGGGEPMTDGGEELETESGGYDFPEKPYGRYEPFHRDIRLDPDPVTSDRQHYDHRYGYPDSLGRIQPTVCLIGPDGFADMWESLAHEPREIIDEYGGIIASQDCAGDYVAWAPTAISEADDVAHAMAVATDPHIAAATVRMWYDREFGNRRILMTRPNDHWRHRMREKHRFGDDDNPTAEYTTVSESHECVDCGSTVHEGGRVWKVGEAHSPNRCTMCARRVARELDRRGYTLDGPDPREYDIPDDHLITDGGREDPLWTANLEDIPEDEREKYEKRRELFTCDDCGQMADAMVSVDDLATVTMVGKSWVDIHHTDSDTGGPTLYFHFDEDEVDRGADLRNLLTEHSDSDEEPEPDPYENPDPPVDDRPDLDQYHRMKARQGRDPHGPRTDGGQPGLFEKYTVMKQDGNTHHYVENCFVLEPESDPAAREALSTYVAATENEELAADLREWLDTLSGDGETPRADGGVDTTGTEHVEWWEKAGRNTEKWGLQDPDALILAMMEELGELANQLVMYSNRGDTSILAEHGRDYIRRIADLGTDVREFLEATSEDENNDPIPPAERPQYYDAFPPDLRESSRVRQLGSELDDLMALGFQFQWRLNNATEVDDE